jgi:hypothetical protein
MPKQNRVDPTGEIIATPAYGTLMGNRGILHNDHQQIIRSYKTKAWIFCQLKFQNNQRTIMSPNSYTELFFLDEATALSAGHRPCAQCMRDRYNEFCTLWAQANSHSLDNSHLTAKHLDNVLHSDRLAPDKTKHAYLEEIDALPAGCFILLESHKQPYLVLDNTLLAWTPAGYTKSLNKPFGQKVKVLTPSSVVKTLKQGFHAKIHDSASCFQT